MVGKEEKEGIIKNKIKFKGESTIFAVLQLQSHKQVSETNPTVEIESCSFLHSLCPPFSPLVFFTVNSPNLPIPSSSLYILFFFFPFPLVLSVFFPFLFHSSNSLKTMSSTEKERETQVYMAKLAEQAERYDGTPHYAAFLILFVFPSYILLFSLPFLELRFDQDVVNDLGL